MIKIYLNQVTSSIILKFKNNKIIYLNSRYEKYQMSDIPINYKNPSWINLNDY